ncbi:MAG: P1 family peptidase [Dehalococcoidia bacterium]|nr:P1 family peptidase [Dehalococcoidia bacterium]
MADWVPGPLDAITDVPGIRVGHWTNRRAATGCTVVRCETCTFAAVDARGGAPGTRETDVLNGANMVRKCHAILLTGGSAFGLGAATGVMRYLREQDTGLETAGGRVPIVSGAVIFDLAIGRGDAWPGDEEGYEAAKRAKRGRVEQGPVGAGTGATTAKLLGPERRLAGGLGTASLVGPRGLVVGALVVTNPVGNVYDPGSGHLLAGPRGDEPGTMLDLPEVLERRGALAAEAAAAAQAGQNTTLVVVATNAALPHEAVQRLAYHAQDGLARCIVPAHTFGDGDTAFAVAMGELAATPEDAIIAGTLATAAVERAIVRSVGWKA